METILLYDSSMVSIRYFNAQIGKKNKPYGNGNGQFWARIEKGKRRHLGRMGNIKKVQNHEYHVSEKAAKTDIDYILTNRLYIVTDVTVNNQINIGSEHGLVMSNMKLDVEVERNK